MRHEVHTILAVRLPRRRGASLARTGEPIFQAGVHVARVHACPMGSEDGTTEDRRLARDRGWARWALQRWESFPVDRQPRPLILTGSPFRFERGFRSGEAKLAFLYGDIKAVVPLPDGLLEVLLGGEDGSRAVPGKRRWSNPLLITQESLDNAQFGTDRGRRVFPAWRLSGPEVDGVFWVLDPTVAATRWKPPEPAPPKPSDGLPHRAASATIEGDDRTLHFTFTGAPPEYAEYPAAEVIETGQALVVLPIARDIGPPGWRATVGCARTVTARLARPLGERVVVDLDASPVMVHPGTLAHQACVP